jgi:7-keto-8-aminopelargonate synthetase-like enzyme
LVRQLAQAGLIQRRVDALGGRHILSHGQRLINFTSSDYLGLAGHPAVRQAASRAAERWGVSLGQPRLWATDRLTAALERALARLFGQEQALVFPSTAAIAHDVLPLMAGPRGVILVDECAYPLSYCAALSATTNGLALCRFQHNDPTHVESILRRIPGARDKVIVCDGVYMMTGDIAPLPDFVDLAERYDATIYLDDAQAVGLLGEQPSAQSPYGLGGGGTPAFCGLWPGRVAHVSTLAKAFGVPLAFVAGPTHFIAHIRATSFNLLHSSPPALPVVAAALTALRVHAAEGERRRQHLIRLVQRYRSGRATSEYGPALPLPVQTIYFGTSRDAQLAGESLRRRHIWPVIQLRPEDNPAGGVLRFVFTSAHRPGDVTALLQALSHFPPTLQKAW